MNLAIICNINSKEPLGIIGVDKLSKSVGYMTNNEELETVIEIILNNNKLELPIKEIIDNNEILRYEMIDYNHSYYLIAFNYHLPYPYRILNLSYIDNDLELAIQENFNKLGDG